MSKHMRCPKCKSTNLQFEIEQIQTNGKMKVSTLGKLHNINRATWEIATLGISNLFIPKAGKTVLKSKITNKKICLCRDCGYMWNP